MALQAVFKIGGKDFTNHVVLGGLEWSRNDMDDEKSGRTLDGVMHRNRITTKAKLNVTMEKMTTDELIGLNTALEPQFVDITYLDPRFGIVTKTFYGSTVSSAVQHIINGIVYWDGAKFNLVER